MLAGYSGAQEVIIIDKGDKVKTKKEIKLNDNIQVIKFAPLNLMIGEINFGYERQTSLKGSVDFEIGPTISKVGFGLDNHYIDPWGAPTEVENSGLGFFLSAGYRFYPLDETEALNRFYVSPVLKYKLLNYSISDISENLANTHASETRLNFYFNFGYQVWVAKSFSMDMYCGFGIGYLDVRDYNAIYEYVDNDYQYRWDENFSSGAVYVGNIGLKIGIGKE